MSVELKESCKPIGWKPIALDGGYGWVVVLGSFLIHVFADGFVYSFGVIADPILHEFKASNAGVSVILALLTGLMMAVGPVASAICNRFGCRVTTIIGAIIASIGCILSSFATSVVYLIMTAGVVMGIGFGLMYCPAIVIVTMYFEKYRSLATGITVCGAGVGTLIFPKILGFLLELFEKENAWRKVFQIYSGVVLLCVPCAALFKPVDFQPIYQEEEGGSKDEESDVLLTGVEDESVLVSGAVNKNFVVGDKLDGQSLDDLRSVEAKPLLETQEANLQLPKPADKFPQRSVSLRVCHPSSSIMSKKRLLQSESNLAEVGQTPRKSNPSSRVHVGAGYLNVTDCFFPRSITQLPAYNEDPQKFRSVTSTAVLSSRSKRTLRKLDLLSEKELEEEEDESATKEPVESTSIWGTPSDNESLDVFALSDEPLDAFCLFLRTVKKMMDLSLFKEPVFAIFAISNFLISIGFDPPPMFMPMYAIHKNWTSSQATTTVSIYGLASIFGRVTFGLICDCKLPFYWGKDRARNRMWIFSVSMILCGLSCCLVFWMNTFWLFGIYCFFFAFSISSCVCLLSVVLVDLVGVDRLTSAFGLLLFIQGVATFVGPPTSGKLYDITCQYYWSFAFCGVCLLLGGAL